MGKILIIGATLAILTGCTTYSKKQCETMDWTKRGSETALRGESLTEGRMHFSKVCKGTPVNEDLFVKGYNEGLKTFCTPEHAYQFASEGGEYKGTCPEGKDNTKFLAKFQSSREGYLKKKISELEGDVSKLKSTVDDQNSEISKLKSSLSDCESKIR